MTRHRKGESEEEYALRQEAERAEKAARKAAALPADTPPAGRQQRSYAADVAALLMPLNEIARAVPGLGEDALTDDELGRAITLGDQAARRYPRVRKVLKRAEQVSFTGACIAFALSLALPRLRRRNLLPPWLAQGLDNAQAAAQRAEQMPVETQLDYAAWAHQQERNGVEPSAPNVYAPGMSFGVPVT